MRLLKKIHFNIVICILIVTLICYLLYQDNLTPISINKIWFAILYYLNQSRPIAIGLLHLYVASMIFGAARLSLYLSQKINYLLKKIKTC